MTRQGLSLTPPPSSSNNDIFEQAVLAGAQDVQFDEKGSHFFPVEDLAQIRGALSEKLGEPEEARLIWVPKTSVPLSDQKALSLLKLID